MRVETKNGKRRAQCVIVFRHDNFQEVEIYCVQRWVKVVEEGLEEHFFEEGEDKKDNAGGAGAVNTGTDDQENAIDTQMFHADNCAEDIVLVRNQGLNVDWDNEPAPENIPVQTGVEANQPNEQEQQWGGEQANVTEQQQQRKITALS